MKISILVTRSEEFVQAHRIATGENFPKEITVEVDTQDLNEECRRIVLAEAKGQYGDIRGITYRVTGLSTAIQRIAIDAEKPNVEQICVALRIAQYIVDRINEKRDTEIAEREARRFVREALEQRKSDARELLADEFAGLRRQIAELESQIPDDDEDEE